MAIACAMVPHPMKPIVLPEAWLVEADMGKEVVVETLLVLKVLVLVAAVLILILDLVVAAVVGVSNG